MCLGVLSFLAVPYFVVVLCEVQGQYMLHWTHDLVAWAMLSLQHKTCPSTVFDLGLCNWFKSAANELAVAIVTQTYSSKKLWNYQDAKMSNDI